MNHLNLNKSLSLTIPTLLFSLFMLCSPVFLQAQITIEEDIFYQRIGKTYKEVLYETNLDIDGQLADIKAAIGPNQTWDFSNLNFIDSTVVIFELMEVDPMDPLLEIAELSTSQYVNKVSLLPGSGGVEDTSTTYVYTSLNDGVWVANGSFTLVDLDLDGSLDSAIQYFMPATIQVSFPVTETSEWFDSTNSYTIFDGMEFLGSIMIDSTWVRGYGTLITPYGTAEALRVHNKKLTKNPFLPIVDESNDYDFVTEDDMMSASIVVEDGRAFYSVRTLMDGPSSTHDLPNINFAVSGVSPNPFTDFIDVNLTMIESGEVQFSLIGIDGKIKSMLQKEYLSTGSQHVQLSIEELPSGMYYLQVRSGQFIQHVPIHKM